MVLKVNAIMFGAIPGPQQQHPHSEAWIVMLALVSCLFVLFLVSITITNILHIQSARDVL